MKITKFIQVQKGNASQYNLLLPLWRDFYRELDANRCENTDFNEVERDLVRRVNIQGSRSDMHFEIAFINDIAVGFSNYAVNLGANCKLTDYFGGAFLAFYIAPEHRRKGYARQMFEHCEKTLIDEGARFLHVCPEPNIGEPFWTAVGFLDSGKIDPDDKLPIYIKTLGADAILNAMPMKIEHIDFVVSIMTSGINKTALHLSDRGILEWRQTFIKNLTDPDEANFIIYNGKTPVAWLKLCGMQNKDNMAAISMLVVCEDCQRQGIGNFAVRFAEDYLTSKKFTKLIIRTTTDNIAAYNLYKKLGYEIIEDNIHIADDGIGRRGFSFFRDSLDAVRMSVDGIYFRLKEAYDFSFICKYGKVFKVFDKQGSGGLCFGTQKDGRRYFLKFAGAKTIKDNLRNIDDTITRLRLSVLKYMELKHPLLINLIGAEEIGGGYITVFDWFDGESCGYPQRETHSKFLALPNEEKMRVYDGILEFHAHVAARGYVAIDFNDQATLYNFANGDFAICDIDFYAKEYYMNGYSGIWGDPSLMSPEESRSGAVVDEISNVYAMGATAFVFFAGDDKYAKEKWALSDDLYNVAKKAVSETRNGRYQTIAEYIAAWNAAKLG